MLTLTKIKTDHPDYSFVEELLHLSFRKQNGGMTMHSANRQTGTRNSTVT